MDYAHFSEKMGGGATAPQPPPPASYASDKGGHLLNPLLVYKGDINFTTGL